MKRMMLRVAGLTVLFGALSVTAVQADTRFSIHVGVGAPVVAPPVVVAPNPYSYGDGYAGPVAYPGYVWQPGYYAGYRWMPGMWIPRAHVAPRWDRHGWRHERHDRRRW